MNKILIGSKIKITNSYNSIGAEQKWLADQKQ